ncbi:MULTISPECIES: hypothetical protein [unclassified Caballeronia]|uniref:hypothetical protein n=1 Tax=unclassified Caballeronia TaxID=2646786 RepID=UPI002866CF5B|nr:MULTISPECIES: hypothetical protein [unclassified Caballeronia]MDR5812890.1 hypothetical protein [Caballeronia sp. LZ033]MDR5819742.1 hypothetical protein [Caballeronia sp. LZ043]MDR5877511.1 hypothetical protein [Caballeronia sp. LZ032]
MQMTPLTRIAVALGALALLAACEKHDATAGQAVGAFNNLASQTGQKFDQAASYVGQKVDAAKQSAQQNFDNAGSMPDISASGVAASARANFDNAASATQAAINNAASATGAGLQSAGRKLQDWSTRPDGAQAGSQTGVQASGATASSDPGNARAEMDK